MTNFTKTQSLDPFNHKNSHPFYASVSFGLRKNHDSKTISYEAFIETLQDAQRVTYKRYHVHLSAQISQTDIVIDQQLEPHVKLEFINYPEYPETTLKFKEAIVYLCELLATDLDQSRVVINFSDEHRTLSKKNKRYRGASERKQRPQKQQCLDLFKQYQEETPLLLFDGYILTQDILIKHLPRTLSLYEQGKTGIPVYVRAIQGGKAHPIYPKTEIEYFKPTKIAIYTKLLLSGMPISLEIWEVQGKVNLDAAAPGILIEVLN